MEYIFNTPTYIDKMQSETENYYKTVTECENAEL
jgi:hypothetical protein